MASSSVVKFSQQECNTNREMSNKLLNNGLFYTRDVLDVSMLSATSIKTR